MMMKLICYLYYVAVMLDDDLSGIIILDFFHVTRKPIKIGIWRQNRDG